MPNAKRLVRLNVGSPRIMDPIYALLDTEAATLVSNDINHIANRGGYEISNLRNIIKELLIYRGGELMDPVDVSVLEPNY